MTAPPPPPPQGMNLTSTDPVAPPPQPPQPHRSSFSCDRHPDEQFTGFCPSCLYERLTTLDQSKNAASSSRRNSTSSAATAALSAALKSLFSKPTSNKPTSSTTTTSSLLPELRRTKSFSASKNDAVGLHFEPQRKSCDVRGVRGPLSSLFTHDDVSKPTSIAGKASSSQIHHPHNQHYISKDAVDDVLAYEPVSESQEEEIEVVEEPELQANSLGEQYRESSNCVEEIMEAQQPRISHRSEIVEEDVVIDDETLMKPMKDHIDSESQPKRASTGGGMKEIAGTFKSAASVFSKKWQKWRLKQKAKKQNIGRNSGILPVEKPLSRQYRDTQSEVADYGFGRRSCDVDPRFSLDAGRISFGRRSCDIDPRFSLDAGRISFDDPRYSFEEPRASWDGHLLGRSLTRMNPMVSLVEEAPVARVTRSDSQIPVEETGDVRECANGSDSLPGGSAQTREYYADSSSRRRKSLDRSSSIRKTAAAVVADIDEMKGVSNAKVSPNTVDYFQGPKDLVLDKGFRYSNSSRDDISETFELGSLKDNAPIIGNGELKEAKKSRRWSWNIWGFIQRRSSGNKDDDDDSRYSRVNGVDRSFSGSWQELRRDGNGDGRGGLNGKVFRSNSSVSWRNSTDFGGSFGNVGRLSVDMNGHGNKRRDGFVLERNQSARYSPKKIGNGLLRFYLTPMGSSRRGGFGKSRLNGSYPVARSVMQHV